MAVGMKAQETQWLARLGMYRQLRALKFTTRKGLHAAIDALWNPGDPLYGMPRAIGDALTMIVPAEAVPLFKERKWKFREYPVGSRGERPSAPTDIVDSNNDPAHLPAILETKKLVEQYGSVDVVRRALDALEQLQ